MWGKTPFFIPDNYAIDARNLADLRDWYKEKLGLRESTNDRAEDSGRPFADLHISTENTFLSLVQLPPGATAEKSHVILYTKHLEKAHEWLVGRGVFAESISTDSGGNRLFLFHDLEGNKIEVCVEPG